MQSIRLRVYTNQRLIQVQVKVKGKWVAKDYFSWNDEKSKEESIIVATTMAKAYETTGVLQAFTVEGVKYRAVFDNDNYRIILQTKESKFFSSWKTLNYAYWSEGRNKQQALAKMLLIIEDIKNPEYLYV